jgi:hypothetical protein
MAIYNGIANQQIMGVAPKRSSKKDQGILSNGNELLAN